jgi:membrane protein
MAMTAPFPVITRQRVENGGLRRYDKHLGGLKEIFSIIKDLFRKYQQDNAPMMVAAIAFYILLTFIPFALLSISILGYLMNLSDIEKHLLVYTAKVIPEPFNDTVTAMMAKNLKVIAIWKRFSGPLGLYFLFFFTSKLFSMLIPSFQVIFGKKMDSFLRKKGKEFFFTLLFSLLQTVIFLITATHLVATSKLVGTISDKEHVLLEGSFYLYLISLIDMACTFAMFYLLYYVLTPLRKRLGLLLPTTLLAALLWGAGKFLFKYYAVRVVRFTAIFGAYGIFIAFLFWLYYSVFVFIVCAELQSVLLQRLDRGPRPGKHSVSSLT